MVKPKSDYSLLRKIWLANMGLVALLNSQRLKLADSIFHQSNSDQQKLLPPPFTLESEAKIQQMFTDLMAKLNRQKDPESST